MIEELVALAGQAVHGEAGGVLVEGEAGDALHGADVDGAVGAKRRDQHGDRAGDEGEGDQVILVGSRVPAVPFVPAFAFQWCCLSAVGQR